ncbi:MAG: aldehyde dehydrogenase family protein, partial [Bacteroidales bacterium]|nr:aldehyde dehydrogenase family protein [Bacteroidales bacterium]
MDNVQTVINRQKAFFTSRKTKEPEYRIRALKKLKDTIQCREEGIFAALQQDLGKSPMESYATEIALVLEELTTQIKHLKHWASPRRVKTPLTHFISHSYILPEPYGVILIIAPWNYPFQLLMTPLAGALAAGNCVALKSSRFAPATQEVMESIIGECFPEEYVSFFRGGNDINQSLLQERFDYIFFTGGTETGRHVMEAAAHFLTPVSLELGGKSPVIVDKDADLELAARRIIWGKCINAGQTCVA